jgi:hypothetical protein
MGYQPVKLIYNSYIPDQLEPGMLFAVSVTINEHSYLHVHKLEKLPRNIEKYIQENGYPVKPYLIRAIDSNPDKAPEEVAYPDQIAYCEQEGLLYDFTIDDMNYISMEDQGYVGLYFDDETDKPTLEDGRVIVTSMDNLWNADDDEFEEHDLFENYNDDDWDVTLQDGLEEL